MIIIRLNNSDVFPPFSRLYKKDERKADILTVNDKTQQKLTEFTNFYTELTKNYLFLKINVIICAIS